VLADYLADGPYQFSMAFGRGEFEDFYSPTEHNEPILSERRKWLAEDEPKYLAVLAESPAFLEEAAELGRATGTLPHSAISTSPNPKALARSIGENWEPDWLILKKEAGRARLVSGCVCFPSSWSLDEKIGHPIEEIHGVVPALNSTVGKQIGTFLDRIKPGVSWTRSNWGLSRSLEWNQHPTRNTPRLDPTVTIEEVFFRVEEQSLVALPKTNGILFGIRLKVEPLSGHIGTPAGLKLAHLMETMPVPMAQYKGLSTARARIINLLRGENGKSD
jgi:hypothetical protein